VGVVHVLRPPFSFSRGLVTLQPASWFVGYRTVKPAFGNERIEIILPKGLAVFDANKRLDFTRLAGLLAEPENLDGDMAGDLAGRLDFMFLGFYDKRGMKGQAHEKTGSVSV
jgi:hypothetical protein